MRTQSTWHGTVVALIALIAMIAATAFIEFTHLGNTTVAGVSDEVFTWFAPAGYVFMIWIVIYVALAIWCVNLSRTSTGDERFAGMPLGRDVVLFVVSCVLNIAWLVLWHLHNMVGSVIVIVVLLAVVAALYIAAKRPEAGLAEWMPLSIYAAWLLVAFVANAARAITGASSSASRIVPVISTILLLLALLAISYAVRARKDDVVFPLPIIWAGIGIGVRLMGVSTLTGVLVIALTALGGAAIYIPWNRVSISGRSGR
ncbi:tryptophan-rich sensory protein [Coriobacterium glomerans]|nr:tryptophan-rich sensory protein [Coriobacterium glomerans]